MTPPARVLYWFRTDLRLHDSPALKAALAIDNIEAFYPVRRRALVRVVSVLMASIPRARRYGALTQNMYGAIKWESTGETHSGHRSGYHADSFPLYRRWQFLLESMQDVSDSLHALNSKQRLHVLRGSPEKVLPLAWESWGITHMVFEKARPAVAPHKG